MADKAWKKDERKVAAFFGVKRTPFSGSTSGHTSSDTLHPEIYIEAKRRKHHAAISLWDKEFGKATREGKTLALALTEHGRPGFWLVVHSADLVAVADARRDAMIGGDE